MIGFSLYHFLCLLEKKKVGRTKLAEAAAENRNVRDCEAEKAGSITQVITASPSLVLYL